LRGWSELHTLQTGEVPRKYRQWSEEGLEQESDVGRTFKALAILGCGFLSQICCRAGANAQTLQLFPVHERQQLVETFLQPLEPTFMILRCAVVFFLDEYSRYASTDLGYFLSQFHYALFDGIWHDDRLPPQDISKKSGQSYEPPSEIITSLS
jgi:hypothetical protein